MVGAALMPIRRGDSFLEPLRGACHVFAVRVTPPLAARRTDDRIPPHKSADATPRRRRSLPLNKLRYIGPAFIVGALTFGPGNAVASATLGAESGYTVLWLLVLSSILMLVFTDMAVRIAMCYPTSIIQAIKNHIARPVGVIAGICFFILAVTFGAGSMIGASLGLQVITGMDIKPLSAICAAAAIALLWSGGAYKRLERVMVVAMAVMAVAFISTAVISGPDLGAMAAGLVPRRCRVAHRRFRAAGDEPVLVRRLLHGVHAA